MVGYWKDIYICCSCERKSDGGLKMAKVMYAGRQGDNIKVHVGGWGSDKYSAVVDVQTFLSILEQGKAVMKLGGRALAELANHRKDKEKPEEPKVVPTPTR
jgi:hypothetical protein